jgi:hypothetical protein
MALLQLEGQVDTRDETIRSLEHAIESLTRKLTQTDEALRLERNRNGQMEHAFRELRRLTQPFYKLLGAVHGELDGLGIDGAVSATPQAPQFDPRWEAWKQKLGPGLAPARIIDALLTHGPLNRTQLRQVAELGWSTLDAATSRLKNLSLIEKVSDRWKLKES